jgi:5-methyltetrahydropteroyltriglutamate--homocysteine methyltransferase
MRAVAAVRAVFRFLEVLPMTAYVPAAASRPMRRSTDRILTTHVGSLIRPSALLDQFRAAQAGDAGAGQAYEAMLKGSVEEIVREQVAAGVDVVDDGEFGKSTSWSL